MPPVNDPRRGGPIVFLGHATERTGPPIYLLQLIRWLRRHHPELDVHVVAAEGGPLEEEFRSLCPTHVVGRRDLSPEVRPWLHAVEQSFSRRERPKLAESVRNLRWTWYARRRLADLPSFRLAYVNTAGTVQLERVLPHHDHLLVSHVHELDVGLAYHMPPGDLRRVLRRSAHLLAVSGAVEQNLVRNYGVDPARLSRHPGMVVTDGLPDPVDAGERRARRVGGLPADAAVVGSSGTTIWRKAPDVFVRMAWELCRRRPEVSWRFVWVGGDAAGVADLEALAAEAGLSDVMWAVGEQPDPVGWFSAFDVFVLPAREDAFPLVCLEALAVAVPVVCFDNGGMPELVREGCGLVASWPDVGELAGCVERLVDDEDLRHGMGRRGAELVRERHDVEVLAPKVWDAITHWLEHAPT